MAKVRKPPPDSGGGDQELDKRLLRAACWYCQDRRPGALGCTSPCPIEPFLKSRGDAGAKPVLQFDSRVEEILASLDRERRRAPSIGQIAKEVGLGASRLSHLFQHDVGMSLGAFLRTRRLGHAAHLLLTTHLNMSEICFCVGFNDLTNFGRQFRLSMGLSPSEYRRQYRKLARDHSIPCSPRRHEPFQSNT
jgi:AraC-like DNA-binding protein